MMLGYGTSSRRHGALALFLFAQLIGSQWFVVGLQAENPKPGENPDYTISPKTVVRGKDYNVVIRPRSDCKVPRQLENVHVDLDNVSGFNVSMEGGNGCFLRFNLSVANDAPLGEFNVPLVKRVKGEQKRNFEVLTLHVSSVAPGPIPPGLHEQVDILWKVLPRHVTSHSFGRVFTDLHFAIEVVIGNDSGYDLQIAAIGFEPPVPLDAPIPTDAYNITRATLEREQQTGRRALIVNSIKALGPILTGSAVFFKSTGASSTWNGSVGVFSNPLEKGFELVYPDKTVRQLIALDNRSLRDSVIVPNNISQRILVFISREWVECRKGDTVTKKGVTASKGDRVSSCKSAPTADPRYARLPHSRDFDPQLVMRRLGKLVIVGRKIEYLNRVRVVSTPQPIVSPPPVVRSSSELSIAQGKSNQEFTLTGNALRGAAVSVEAGSRLKIFDVEPSADGAVLRFKATAPDDCKPQKYKLYVNTSAGQETLEIEVTAEAPKPKTGPDPAFLTQGDSKKEVVFKGEFLKDAKAEILGEGGEKITGADKAEGGGAGDRQTLTLTLTVAPATEPKKYEIKLSRPSGKAATFPFTIKAQEPPTVSSPSAVTGKTSSGKPFQFDITGSNLKFAKCQGPEDAAVRVIADSRTNTRITCEVDTSKARAGDSFDLTVMNGDKPAAQKIKFTVAK